MSDPVQRVLDAHQPVEEVEEGTNKCVSCANSAWPCDPYNVALRLYLLEESIKGKK